MTSSSGDSAQHGTTGGVVMGAEVVAVQGVVVVGNGAEGGHDALGRCLVDLRTAGWQVQSVDPAAAEASCMRGSVVDVFQWTVREFDAALVLFVDCDPEVVGALPDGVPVLRVERSVALAAFAALFDAADGTGEAQTTGPADEVAATDADRQFAAVLAALRATAGTCREAVQVRDRAPRVTMVVPFYGVAEYLHATMLSALSQSYDDYEVLALDDGSVDGSAAMLETYASNPKVRVVRQENIGQTARMDIVNNQLVRHARGELIACLGGDDICFPGRLAAQVEAFDADPLLDVCHGTAEFVSERGRSLGRTWGIWSSYDEWSMLRVIMRDNVIGHPSVMIRKEAVITQGGYEQGLATDYHFWMKTAGKLRYRYLPLRMLGYRLHEKSLSTSTEGYANAQLEGLRLRADILERRPFEDLWPELRDVRDPRVRAEAAIVLGNSLLALDPRLAVLSYAHGVSSGSAAAMSNTAIAHALAGERDEAVRSAKAAAAIDRSAKPLLNALLSGRSKIDVTLRAPKERLMPALVRARKEHAASIHRWDGTTLDVDRAYVAMHPERDDLARGALEAWCRSTRDEDRVRWIHPTLGQDMDTLLERIARLSQGLDLARAGEMVIEQVDGFEMLPPNESGDRLTLALTVGEELNTFRRWIMDPALNAPAGNARERVVQI